MGKLIPLHPNNIIPSRRELSSEQQRCILDFFRTAAPTLPPPPLVKREGNSFVAMDGHDLLAVCQALDIECEVYLVDHPQDKLPGNSSVAKKRNAGLAQLYAQTAPLQTDFATLNNCLRLDQ